MNLPETWLSSFKVWNLKNQQSLFSKAIHAANGIPPSQQRALCLKVWGWGASKTCQLRSVVGVQTIGKCNLIAEMAFKKTTFPQPCERNTMKGNSQVEVWCLYTTWAQWHMKQKGYDWTVVSRNENSGLYSAWVIGWESHGVERCVSDSCTPKFGPGWACDVDNMWTYRNLRPGFRYLLFLWSRRRLGCSDLITSGSVHFARLQGAYPH